MTPLCLQSRTATCRLCSPIARITCIASLKSGARATTTVSSLTRTSSSGVLPAHLGWPPSPGLALAHHVVRPDRTCACSYLLFKAASTPMRALHVDLEVGEGFWPGYSGLGNCTVAWHSKAMLGDNARFPTMKLGLVLSALKRWKAQHACRKTFEARVVGEEVTCQGARMVHLGYKSQHDRVMMQSFVETKVLEGGGLAGE